MKNATIVISLVLALTLPFVGLVYGAQTHDFDGACSFMVAAFFPAMLACILF